MDKKMTFYLLQALLQNAYTLYRNFCPEEKKKTHLQFQLEAVDALLKFDPNNWYDDPSTPIRSDEKLPETARFWSPSKAKDSPFRRRRTFGNSQTVAPNIPINDRSEVRAAGRESVEDIPVSTPAVSVEEMIADDVASAGETIERVLEIPKDNLAEVRLDISDIRIEANIHNGVNDSEINENVTEGVAVEELVVEGVVAEGVTAERLEYEMDNLVEVRLNTEIAEDGSVEFHSNLNRSEAATETTEAREFSAINRDEVYHLQKKSENLE